MTTDDHVAERYAHLRRAAFLMCGDWTRAGTMARDTLARALTDAEVGDIDLWAYSDLMSSFRPGRGRREHVFVAPPAGSGYAVGFTDAERGLSDVYAVLVLNALRGLPPKVRAVLILHHFCHLDVADTADVLGLDGNKVTEHEAQGLAAFTDLLRAGRPESVR